MRKDGCCVYCGYVGKVEPDHIPPACLFKSPRPSNLITVPACSKCNREASLDDEYFRLALAIEDHAGEHEDARAVQQEIFRSLQNPRKLKFAAALKRAIVPIDVCTPAGIFLGTRAGYRVELSRLDRVAVRIIKGLFYRVRKHRLPDNYRAAAWQESGIRLEEKKHIVDTIVRPLLASPPTVLGNNVFAYWCHFVAEDENTSAWLLQFYRHITFVGSTVPESACAAR